MDRPAKDGRHLADLVQMAIPLCKAAQAKLIRRGPGRPPVYEEWQIALLIFVAILQRRKSKSSQWNFLSQHRPLLMELLQLTRFPTRSTYFARYKRAWRIYEKAIELQGRKALQEHVSSARVIAADKSLIAAKGPAFHKRQQKAGKPRRGTDTAAAWGCSGCKKWVFGYSYEVVVCAPKKQVVFPLLASVDVGSRSEKTSFGHKIPLLPPSVRFSLEDKGYDSNRVAEAFEYLPCGRRSGRRFVCPPHSHFGKPAVGRTVRKGRREQSRQRRVARDRFYRSKRGRSLYRRRKQTVEPFNQWFKNLFELNERVWHRGLENNRTMILAAMFAYQLLVRYSFRHGRRDGQVQWILDGL